MTSRIHMAIMAAIASLSLATAASADKFYDKAGGGNYNLGTTWTNDTDPVNGPATPMLDDDIVFITQSTVQATASPQTFTGGIITVIGNKDGKGDGNGKLELVNGYTLNPIRFS